MKLSTLLKQYTEKEFDYYGVQTLKKSWDFFNWILADDPSINSKDKKRMYTYFSKMYKNKRFTRKDIEVLATEDHNTVKKRFNRIQGFKEFENIFSKYRY